MKIEMKNGAVKVTSETAGEAKKLMKFLIKDSKNESDLPVMGKRGRHNPWKGKHTKPCPECGGMFKNITNHLRGCRGTVTDFPNQNA